MQRAHKAFAFGVAAIGIAFVTIQTVSSAAGKPPSNPPPDPLWVMWIDPAEYAEDCGEQPSLYCPTAPAIEMGPDSSCFIYAKDGAQVRATLYERNWTLNSDFPFGFPEGENPCPSCNVCAFVWPTTDPEGQNPTEYPLTKGVAVHLVPGEDGLYAFVGMSAVPRNKQLRYWTNARVKDIVDYEDGSFDLIIRENAVPLYRSSGPDQDVVFGYISIGDLHFRTWPLQ